MAFSTAEKLKIAERIAGGKKPYSIAKELGISRSSISYALEHDKELIEILERFSTNLDDYKKRESEKAIKSLKDLYEKRLDSLLSTWCDLVDLPKEAIEVSSIRDRVGAAKLILEMVESLANSTKDESTDNAATTIEIIVEDASIDE